MAEDPRQAAARYRLARDGQPAPDAAAERARDAADGGPAGGRGREASAERGSTAADRAAYVETAIQQAIRRGEFDDLPGAGKPLELGAAHDPDWWIRRKIQSEGLTGLGPPALTLRVEHAEMAGRLDALGNEDDVREAVADFNRRVIEARRQLLGGPPVITPTLDVDAEVAAWHARRPAPPPPARVARKRRFFRRNAAEGGEWTDRPHR
jgi:hypothetical protein